MLIGCCYGYADQPPGEALTRTQLPHCLLTDTPLHDLVSELSSATTVLNLVGKLRVLRYWDPPNFEQLADSPTLSPLLHELAPTVHWITLTAGRLSASRTNPSKIRSTQRPPPSRSSVKHRTRSRPARKGNQVLMGLRSQGNGSDTTTTQHAAVQAIKSLDRRPKIWRRYRGACCATHSPTLRHRNVTKTHRTA